jgi:hypothetical protein
MSNQTAQDIEIARLESENRATGECLTRVEDLVLEITTKMLWMSSASESVPAQEVKELALAGIMKLSKVIDGRVTGVE